MFEDLSLSQKDMAQQLTFQIQSRTFTQVNLFGGERYSLRMTTAIECARVLSCKEEGGQFCRCSSCRKFETMSMQNLVIVSHRDHNSVIETALSSFIRLRSDFSRRFLVRSIRILLLQYHASLMVSGQSAAQSAKYESASAVNDMLLDIVQGGDELSEKDAKALVQPLRTALKPLLTASKKNTTISVNQVRSLEEWVRRTSMGEQKRFIILEGLEETNASARNSLLKMLEEPPQDVYFFLISEFPNRIMQTILSRVRKYTFPPLKQESIQALLAPFFVGDTRFEDLESFFLQGGGLDLARNEESAQQLLSSILEGRALQAKVFYELVDFIDSQESYEYVLKRMLTLLGEMLKREEITWQRCKALSEIMSEIYSTATLFNQNKKLMFQTLYLKLMEVT